MLATMLSFAVLEGMKKAGRLPEFREDYRIYVLTAGAVLAALIAVASIALRQRDKAED